MYHSTRPSRVASDKNIDQFLRRWENPFNARARWIESLVKEHGWTTGAELGVKEGRVFMYLLWKCQELTMHGIDVWVHKGADYDADVLPIINPSKVQAIASGAAGSIGANNFSINYGYYVNIKEFTAGYNGKGRDRSVLHRMNTNKAAKLIEDKSLDFIFIDADHHYEHVKNDILTWLPKVKDDGWILGHDIDFPDVERAVRELLPNFEHAGVETCWFIKPQNRPVTK